MQQVQMVPGAGPEPKMKVYYEGTDTLKNGYCLCSNTDYTASALTIGPLPVAAITAASACRERWTRAEKPKIGNIHRFLGVVVGLGEAGRAGPGMFDVARPCGAMSDIWTGASCTIDSTVLYLVAGSYAASNTGNVRIGLAAQTVDRSTTNGAVLGYLEAPGTVIPATGGQAVNGSDTFTAAIWDNFPLDELRANPSRGVLLEYDPKFNPMPVSPYAVYTGAHMTVALTANTALGTAAALVLTAGASVADNDAVAVQFPGPIDVSGGKPWAFEVLIACGTVTDTDVEWLVGLLEASTLANATPFANGGALAAAADIVCFDVKADDGNSIDVSYQKGGETPVLHDDDVGVPTAATDIKLGMYYNGTTITPYVNGTATTAITAADIASLTDVFPAALTGYFTAALKGDSGVAAGDNLSLRAFRVAQIR